MNVHWKLADLILNWRLQFAGVIIAMALGIKCVSSSYVCVNLMYLAGKTIHSGEEKNCTNDLMVLLQSTILW